MDFTIELRWQKLDASKSHLVEKLYQSTGQAALSKTLHLVGRRDIAEEIVQEVFLKLWKKKLTFYSNEAAYCWVYRSCHNAGIDHIRAVKRHGESELDEELAGGDDYSDRVAERQLLNQAAKILGKKESQVLAYRVVDGMTQDEIATMMDVSRKTIVRFQKKIDAKLTKIRRELTWN